MGMKHIIKKLLKEALGVPEGIVENAKKLYDDILYQLNQVDPENTDTEHRFIIKDRFKIGDYTINKVSFTLELREHSQATEPTIASFGFGAPHNIEISDKIKMVHNIDDNISLMSDIVIPSNHETNFKDIVQLFVNERNKIIRSLSHELKHSYDYYKKSEKHPYSGAMYQSYANTALGLLPVDKFIHDMYFTHLIENLVRPSEVAAEMDIKGVTRKQFLEFLENDETYKNLKRISNFSVDNLKEELRNYLPKINEILESLDDDTNISDDQKLERILELTYITLINTKGNVIKSIISTEITEKLFGMLRPDKVPFFNQMIKSVQRFPSYKEFFKYEEKKFKYVSNNMMRKLAKLYAISKTDESYIFDWDLHQKIRGKYKGFVKESKYFKKK
jgi:hypothetical protein